MTDPDRSPHARRDLGHSQTLAVKLHPDLLAWVQAQATANYSSHQEVIRRLIVEAMRREQETNR